MIQDLLTLSHGPLQWKPTLPPQYKGIGLPGGTPVHTSGDFGVLTIQQCLTPFYRLQLHDWRLSVQQTLHRQPQPGFINILIVINGVITVQCKSGNHLLNKNQYGLLCPPDDLLSYTAGPGQLLFFSFLLQEKWVNEIIQTMPFSVSGKKQKAFAGWMDSTLLGYIQNIVRSRYDEPLLSHYIENKVKDILLHLYYLINKIQEPSGTPSEKELEAIYKAEEIITSNLKLHFQIPELAKKVAINEYTLKKVFKQVFGMGPYEYLTKKRMELAKELLQQGHAVKEVAAEFGYRSSHFTTLFQQYTGYNPSSLHPKK